MHGPHGDLLAVCEVPADAVGHRDRAMPATRTADGDREVRLAFGHLRREEEVEKAEHAPVELRGKFARLDVLDHRPIHPG